MGWDGRGGGVERMQVRGCCMNKWEGMGGGREEEGNERKEIECRSVCNDEDEEKED